MRILTAGESHGSYEVGIIEGFPKGVTIKQEFINKELKRRMAGFGRGKRMDIEADTVGIVSGVRDEVTLASPIAVLVKNKDARILSDKPDNLPPLLIPRPGHADLAGALKFNESDIRNILERSSARETVMRVAIGSICKQFLANFSVDIASFTIGVGAINSTIRPKNIKDLRNKLKDSQLNCIDRLAESKMISQIKQAQIDKDTLGGVVEIWLEGVCPGLGSFMHFDKRLDTILSGYLMSIPAVKGVEIGLGFEYAHQLGSKTHDAIYYSKEKGFYHKTNNSGGIEAGLSNGETIVLRIAMKPIPTLLNPLDSVNLKTKKSQKAIVERSDTCAISACGVVAEAMAAIALTQAYLDKFGGDHLSEIISNYKSYINQGVK